VDAPAWRRLTAWYDTAHRDLPWRGEHRTPWGVLVSEVMLQQTPVARVLPVYEGWLARWPTVSAMAGASPADAVRAWDRLGYPRRALRLREAALACVDRHQAEVPADPDQLRALPGVGAYTAAAVAAFAFGRPVAVVDVNVARVMRRAADGIDDARPVRRSDVAGLQDQLPARAPEAVRANTAVMELGALVCTARAPRCHGCPWQPTCAWHAAGHPPATSAAPRQPAFPGSDRQVRGRLLAVLRQASGPVSSETLAQAWTVDQVQRERALQGLVADGLVEHTGQGWALPGPGTQTGAGTG
jgi:A/G-specific adenine glycosylase